jgi:hypothetical protein
MEKDSYVSGSGDRKEPDPAMGQRKRVMVPASRLQRQKATPCDSFEDAINGGCWIKLDPTRFSPPCPEKTFEYEGGCYRPVGEPPKIPSSTDGNNGEH